MEDRFGKYLRLSGNIFFLFIGFILTVGLLLITLRLLFGLMGHISWFVYAYMLLILLLPAALFITCFIIYFRRSRSYPKKIVRWISYMIFSAGLISWIIVLGSDIAIFSKHAYTGITKYYSYNLLFLSLNVFFFFLVGIIQALATGKEADWMERVKSGK